MFRPLARGRRAPAAVLALLAVLFLLPAPSHAASYPPWFHFRTISTARVSVHFPDGYEAMARQAAALADEILERHTRRYGQTVGRVHVVIVDAQDDPNGFASPLPYPLVTIRAVAPDGSDAFGNLDGWLRLVLTHELAHVVHLETAHGLWRAGRHVFGRAPFLFPNSLAMSWMIEGLATYEETEGTAFGRGRNPDSRMVLRAAALEGRFPKEDQAIYGLDAWPAGQTPYVFGEAFLRRLTDESGPETMPRMARQHATQIIPFLDGRTVKKATGAGLHRQWKTWAGLSMESFEHEVASRRAAGLTESVAVTTRGIRQNDPRFAPDGQWIAYSSGTLERFPEIRLVRRDGTSDRRVALRSGGSGLSWAPDGRALVFAELHVHRTFAVHGDLAAVDVESGRVRRLTRGMRAYDPDVSPDGRTVVFARKLGDRSDLFTVALAGGGVRQLTASAAGVEWSGPRWSPTADAVVAARLLPGGWLDVVLVDPATGAVRQLTHDRAKDIQPTFTPDGAAVVFCSDRDGVSNLHSVRLADGRLSRVTNVLGGAFQPSVSPDGRAVAFSSYSAKGFDVRVAALPPPPDPGAPAGADGNDDAGEAFVDTHPAPPPDPTPSAASVEPYHPWSMLWPRFWTPWVDLGGDDDRFGVATGGSDALFRHVWAAQASYGRLSERLNASGFYLYDRFRTTLLVTGQDTTDVYSNGPLRTQEVNVQAALPVRRTIRSVQTLSATYRLERQAVLGSTDPDDRLNLGGIETAWTLASARSYPMSISPSEGGRLRLAWLHEAEGLGSDLSLDKATAEARYYRRVFGARDVLALRASGGTTWGEPKFERSFAVGGYPDSSLFDIVRTNAALLRGYPDDAFTGRRYASASVEYRFPLFTPQRGWRSLPVFLRHFRGTVFFDAAHAWSKQFQIDDVKTAAGASIGVDTALGYALPATAELTVARGFDEPGDTRVYLRFGLAF
jgi:Tol biopolymer transport system component